MFKKVNPKQNFIKLEHQILDFWKKNKIFQKLQKKNRGKKHWSFIDGPITANNPMGVHHAWGRTLKDVFQRYKAMQGFDQRFQNGFDCQGLHLEVETEKDLGFNSKKDIERFGLANFSRACKNRVKKFSKIQTNQSIRLGQWMDWENSYYTMSDENIQAIWYFLEKCHRNEWLYKDYDVMPWCTRCGTALSQHELSDEGWKEVVHDSVYIKLPIKDRIKEYFLVWTTTPWTLTSNVALAVHPDLTYVKAKKQDEIFYLIKKSLDRSLGQAEILDEFPGKDLIDFRYDGPFDEFEAQQGVQHKVIPWKEVGEEEGTGIVHIAPGCGAEDFELSKLNNLKVISPLDEDGNYVEGFGWLRGRQVLKVQDDIFDALKKKGYLFKIEKYRHRYPHCWRCKTPLVFRAVNEWFIRCAEIREKMKKEAEKVKWIPASVGKRMQDWLENMSDWVISRKRFWGLPLPFYECKCGEVTVVQSKNELKKLAARPWEVDDLPELHRPWIDKIKIICPKCQREVSRIPEVGDCWLDAGIVPFSTLKYFKDKSYWLSWFPAEFICEMRAQVRLWFYSLLFMSCTLEGRTPYKQILAYEEVRDEKGQAMHKSAGNVIWFDEAVEKMGADVMRWMYCRQNPSHFLRFGWRSAEEIKRKLILLWNVYSFFITYARIDKFKPGKVKKYFNKLDLWIISLLNQTILEVTEMMEKFDTAGVMRQAERFLDNLANWYVRRSRRRFWKSENDEDKKAAYETLYQVLLKFVQILAPIIPFVTEEIYQNLTGQQSIFLCDWPKFNKNLIDQKLNKEMELVRKIAALALACRARAGIKVRQPLEKLKIKKTKSYIARLKISQDLLDLLKDEVNVKKIEFVGKIKYKVVKERKKEIVQSLEKDFTCVKEGDLVVALKTKLSSTLRQEGMAREFVRFVQKMRKEVNYNVDDRVATYYYFKTKSKQFEKMLEKFSDYIKRETLSLKLVFGKTRDIDLEEEVEINGQEVWLGVKKIKKQ